MPSKKGTYKSKAPKTIKGVSMSGLTTRQASAMKKHSKHHTSKHLKSMVSAIKKGKTFTESHKLAMKKVGK
tara:strand:+ start:70 stop:282 length:213 start_codon:yes stop_codon:yes gene_type:complete